MRLRGPAVLLLVHLACMPASFGAGALLHPGNRPLPAAPALAHRDVVLDGDGFRTADVSPVASAARIGVPVLVIHGAADAETSPAHSRRVFAALAGPKTLRIVDGAGHNEALGRIWPDVERWIVDVAVGGSAAGGGEVVAPPASR